MLALDYFSGAPRFLPLLNFYVSYSGRKKIFLLMAGSGLATFLEGLGVLGLIPYLIQVISGGSTGDSHQFHEMMPDALNFPILDSAFFLGLILLIFLTKSLIVYATSIYIAKEKIRVLTFLRENMLTNIKAAGYGYFLQHGSKNGDFVSTFSEHAFKVSLGFQLVIQILSQVISTSVYLVFVIFVTPLFSLFLGIFGLLIFFVYSKLNLRIAEMSMVSSKATSDLGATVSEIYSHSKYLHATDRWDIFFERARKNLKQVAKTMGASEKLIALGFAMREPSILIFLVAAIFAGVELFPGGDALVLVSILLLHRATQSLLVLQNGLQHIFEYQGAVELIKNELKRSSEVGNLEVGADDAHTFISENESFSLNVSGLRIKYRDTGTVLDLPDLSVTTGECVLVTGPSGSGKSSLLNFLVGLVDGAEDTSLLVNGREILHTNDVAWRRLVGYVGQENPIFEGSICFNVTLSDRKMTASEESSVLKVLRDVGLGPFVESLPYGIQTPIVEFGRTISGGQRQRLCIARELYRKSLRLLIFDEPTSALDREGADEFMKLIQKVKQNVAVLLVSHSRRFQENVDRTILIEMISND